MIIRKKRNTLEVNTPGGNRKRKKESFGGFTLLVVSFWLLSSIFEFIGLFLVKFIGNVTRNGPLKAIQKSVSAVSNLHPEKTVVFFRNLVMAEKAWEIAEMNKKKKPLIILDFHFGHVGILRMLKWRRKKRRAILKLYCPLVKGIVNDPVQADYLARLISVYWDGGQWQLERSFLVESLRNI